MILYVKNNYNFYITKGNINKINLTDSEFTINQEGKNFSINGNLVSKANLKNIQNTLDLFKINLLRGKTEQAEISFNIKSSLSLKLKKYVRLENLKFNGSGKINFLNIKHKINTSKLKKTFTNYNDSFQIKDTEINFLSDDNKHDILLQGLINLSNQ